MHLPSRQTVFAIAVLLVSQLGLVANAQEKSPCRKKVRDALELAVAEQQKFVTYRVECTVTGYLESLKAIYEPIAKRKDGRCKIYYEYSRVDQHCVSAVKDLDNPNAQWIIQGRSGDIGITNSDRESGALMIRRDKSFFHYLSVGKETNFAFFDPLGVGLGFCGDFQNLSASTQLAHCLLHDNLCELKEKDGLLSWTTGSFRNDPRRVLKGEPIPPGDPSGVYEQFGHLTMTLDTKRSYWMVGLDRWGEKSDEKRTHIHWDVKLGKFKEVDIPQVAKFQCKDGSHDY